MSDTKNGSFVKAKDKYADMRSSASSLLIVGILGVIYMVTDSLGILPFTLNPNDNWIFTFTMAALFIVFIIAGICTYKSANKIRRTIRREETLTEDMKTWMTENIKPEDIDSRCEEKRKAAYDAAVEGCLEDAENYEDSDEDTDDVENIDDVDDSDDEDTADELDMDVQYETAEIDGEEYNVIAYESFYDIAEEMKAFEREETIVELVKEQFPDATDAHISYILEEIYDSIFTA